jgi:hypothetical protein
MIAVIATSQAPSEAALVARQVDLFTGTSGAAGARRFPQPCQNAGSK